ncbi:MAG: uvrC [Oscillospiraceae bacterium]|jgi:excinuclease ABC subunit C|nr:uvrC [Oscillospiraceae bacterium]
MNDRIEFLQQKARDLTTSPGVYLMKDKSSKIIYVGKAKNLTNRVRSYFRSSAKHDPKVAKMVENVFDFDYIVTDSEFEALVLECSLIKQYNPKYNILLKDDKGYHYIRVTNEEFPRITAEKMKTENDTHLGPYTSSFSVKQSVDEANRVFMLPTCKRKFPQDFKKQRPCLNYHIKKCAGICKGNISESDYQDTISQAIDYIKKGSANSVKSLTYQMEQAAEDLDFERAAKLRDRIQAISKLNESQKVIRSDEKEQDVISGAQNYDMAAFVVLKFRNGQLVDKENFIFSDVFNLSDARNEFLTRYYSNNVDIPKIITLDESIENIELVREYLCSLAKHSVHINIPQKGEQKKLVLMAMNNASEQLSNKVNLTGKEVAALDELTRLLGLASTPRYIESYDISNLGDSGIVAGMVVFENGRPLKSAYKRFSLRDMPTRDDYGAMSQVIERRLNRYLEQKDSGEGFGRLPDLILLDGGKGHVSTIEPIIQRVGLSIPVFGMVKDDRHRTRAIATDGGEISITSTRSAFHLVSKIQDEVHRFAISYQRKTRKKSMFQMELTKIDGIGPKKTEKIITYFKTKDALKAATTQDLQKIAGVSSEKAQQLFELIQNL